MNNLPVPTDFTELAPDDLLSRLSLTDTQKAALALGIGTLSDFRQWYGLTDAEFALWETDPFFRICLYLRDSVEINSLPLDVVEGIHGVRAGVLSAAGIAYPVIEKLCNFKEGKLLELKKSVSDVFDWEYQHPIEACFFHAEKVFQSLREQAEFDASYKVLSDAQRTAIPLILSGETDRAVAEQVGVTRQTIAEWKNRKDSEFAIILKAERNRVLTERRAAVSELQDKAIETLQDCLTSDDEKVRLKAATSVLSVLKPDKT